MRNHFLRAAVEMVLGHQIVTSEKMLLSLVLLMAVVDLLRLSEVVVSAETRRGNNEKPGKAV